MRVRVGLSMAAAMLIGQAAVARAPAAKAAAAVTDADTARDHLRASGAVWVLAACGFGLLGAGLRQRRPGLPAV